MQDTKRSVPPLQHMFDGRECRTVIAPGPYLSVNRSQHGRLYQCPWNWLYVNTSGLLDNNYSVSFNDSVPTQWDSEPLRWSPRPAPYPWVLLDPRYQPQYSHGLPDAPRV